MGSSYSGVCSACVLLVLLGSWTGGKVLRFRPAGGARARPPFAGRSATYHRFRLGLGDHDAQPTQGQPVPTHAHASIVESALQRG